PCCAPKTSAVRPLVFHCATRRFHCARLAIGSFPSPDLSSQKSTDQTEGAERIPSTCASCTLPGGPERPASGSPPLAAARRARARPPRSICRAASSAWDVRPEVEVLGGPCCVAIAAAYGSRRRGRALLPSGALSTLQPVPAGACVGR